MWTPTRLNYGEGRAGWAGLAIDSNALKRALNKDRPKTDQHGTAFLRGMAGHDLQSGYVIAGQFKVIECQTVSSSIRQADTSNIRQADIAQNTDRVFCVLDSSCSSSSVATLVQCGYSGHLASPPGYLIDCRLEARKVGRALPSGVKPVDHEGFRLRT